MKGFFTAAALPTVKAPEPLLAQCGACGLLKKCRTPKMPFHGRGKRKILVVGEGPGEKEDEQGRPFVGRSGAYLREKLASLGVDLDRDCWVTNSVICRPWVWNKTHTKKENRAPSDKEISYCRPNLTNTVKELHPETILLLGKMAVKGLIGHLWKGDPGPLGKWVGWRIPCRNPNVWVVPTWHPAHLLREENPALEKLYLEHLKRAVLDRGRPWEVPPDYEKEVGVIISPSEAASRVEEFTRRGLPVAFDIETTTLKPDGKDSRIVSAALSDGTRTISYAWCGEVVEAAKGLLRSGVPKIGYNIKFEERWCRAQLGLKVNNWVWDGMLAAHVLDNRPGITGLKFQAFVRLGQGDYDSHVDAYKKSKRPGGNSENRMAEMDLHTLLVYGGLDALLEIKVAELQAEEMGVKLAAQ